MKGQRLRDIKPPAHTPKFLSGQRVRVTPTAVKWQIAPAGTLGTVQWCGLVVRVLIDGTTEAKNYAPDFWESVP